MYKNNNFTVERKQTRRRKSNRSRRSRKVPKLMVELKHYDYYFANTNSYLLPLFTTASYIDDAFEQDTTGSGDGYVCVNQIIQGTTGSTRIGNKYTIASITLHYALKLVGTNKYNSARFLLVYDKYPNGVAPALSDILLSSGIGTALNFESMKNPFHTDRFQILYDKVTDLDSDYKDQVNIKTRVQRKFPVQCQATTGAISDISHGSIYLIGGSQEYAGAAGATTSINCAIVSIRLSFYDL